jgi:hypothetical protein
VTLDFLYQDLFFGALEQASAELSMLTTLAEASQLLGERGIAPGQARAVVAVTDGGDQALLHTKLYAGGALVGALDKPVDLSADLGEELDDLCDALLTLGLGSVDTAAGFTPEGEPEGPEPFVRP